MTTTELVDECSVSMYDCSVLLSDSKHSSSPTAPIWITMTNLYPIVVNYLNFDSPNQLDLVTN